MLALLMATRHSKPVVGLGPSNDNAARPILPVYGRRHSSTDDLPTRSETG